MASKTIDLSQFDHQEDCVIFGKHDLCPFSKEKDPRKRMAWEIFIKHYFMEEKLCKIPYKKELIIFARVGQYKQRQSVLRTGWWAPLDADGASKAAAVFGRGTAPRQIRYTMYKAVCDPCLGCGRIMGIDTGMTYTKKELRQAAPTIAQKGLKPTSAAWICGRIFIAPECSAE